MSRIGSIYMELGGRDVGLADMLTDVRTQALETIALERTAQVAAQAAAVDAQAVMAHMTAKASASDAEIASSAARVTTATMDMANGMSVTNTQMRLLTMQSSHTAAMLLNTFDPRLGALVHTVTYGVMGLTRAMNIAKAAASGLAVSLAAVGTVLAVVGICITSLTLFYQYLQSKLEEQGEELDKELETEKRVAAIRQQIREEAEKALADPSRRIWTAQEEARKTLLRQTSDEKAVRREAYHADVAAFMAAQSDKRQALAHSLVAEGKTEQDVFEKVTFLKYKQVDELNGYTLDRKKILAKELADIDEKALKDKERGEKEAADEARREYLAGLRLNEIQEEARAAEAEKLQARAESRAGAAIARAREKLKTEEPRFQALTEVARQVAAAGMKAPEREPTMEEILRANEEIVAETKKGNDLTREVIRRLGPQAICLIPNM